MEYMKIYILHDAVLPLWTKLITQTSSFSILPSVQEFIFISRDNSAYIKGVVYDSGESLLILELNSQTNTSLPSVLLQTPVLCTSISCGILYKVFSGNAAKALVWVLLVALLEPLCLFPIYRASAVYEHWTFVSAHTQNVKLADREKIFSEVYWIRILDYTIKIKDNFK